MNDLTMEKEFQKIIRQVKNADEFARFMGFCMERLNRGESISEIWNAWNLAKN